MADEAEAKLERYAAMGFEGDRPVREMEGRFLLSELVECLTQSTLSRPKAVALVDHVAEPGSTIHVVVTLIATRHPLVDDPPSPLDEPEWYIEGTVIGGNRIRAYLCMAGEEEVDYVLVQDIDP